MYCDDSDGEMEIYPHWTNYKDLPFFDYQERMKTDIHVQTPCILPSFKECNIFD